jgi:hypothetical protein
MVSPKSRRGLDHGDLDDGRRAYSATRIETDPKFSIVSRTGSPIRGRRRRGMIQPASSRPSAGPASRAAATSDLDGLPRIAAVEPISTGRPLIYITSQRCEKSWVGHDQSPTKNPEEDELSTITSGKANLNRRHRLHRLGRGDQAVCSAPTSDGAFAPTVASTFGRLGHGRPASRPACARRGPPPPASRAIFSRAAQRFEQRPNAALAPAPACSRSAEGVGIRPTNFPACRSRTATDAGCARCAPLRRSHLQAGRPLFRPAI